MDRSIPSVGLMIASGLDSVPRTQRADSPRTRHEAMARGMLDHLLRDRKARRVFARRIAEIDGDVPSFRTSTRHTSDAFDLIGRNHSGPGRTGTLAVKLLVNGDLDESHLAALLARLEVGDSTSRLLLIVPRERRRRISRSESAADPRLLLVTWAQIAARLVSRDEDRAEQWKALAEFGENAAVSGVHQPGSPKLLLKQDVVDELRAHLSTMDLVSRTLLQLTPRFSSSRRRDGAWLHAGASGNDLGIEFDAVEDGSAIWLVGLRPERSLPLRIGALREESERDAAIARLEAIAAVEDWRTGKELPVEAEEFIGAPASRRLEDARALLWDVFDPARLESAGFPLLPRHQPELTADQLSVRVHAPQIPRSGTFLVSIGGSATWRTLLPRVTREFDGRTYVVQAKKSDTAQDLVTAVHKALRSLATKP